jgi:hypothetical protein
MAQSLGPDPRPPHWYYRNFYILGFILGYPRRAFEVAGGTTRRWSLVRSWARFSTVLTIFLITIYAVCRESGILRTRNGVVGLLDDYVMFGVCTWLFLGIPIFLMMIQRLDTVLVAMPALIDTGGSPEARRALVGDIENMRNIISVRHPTAKVYYHILLAIGLALNGVYAFAMPFFRDEWERSWALMPADYPLTFAIAQPWAVFWCTIVFAHYVWLIFAVICTVFLRIYRFGKLRKIVVAPVAIDERGGLRSIGELVFLTMLLSSGGLLISVTWAIVFPNYKGPAFGLMALYSAVLAGLYLIPMWFLHSALKNARRSQLASISLLFTSAYFALINSANESSGTETLTDSQNAALASQVSDMSVVYGRVEGMPKWPVSILMNMTASFVTALPFIMPDLRPILHRISDYVWPFVYTPWMREQWEALVGVLMGN